MKARIHIINGPNLNLLGTREPEIYGAETLSDIEAKCQQKAESLGVDLTFSQTNHEGDLVDWIQAARSEHEGIILNAGAYTHTSVALYDAILACEKPVIEVHISNIYRREPFRHHSYISAAARGVMCGFGPAGYTMALDAMSQWVKQGK
jgi:3-dehydroquinate dehydratase-2